MVQSSIIQIPPTWSRPHPTAMFCGSVSGGLCMDVRRPQARASLVTPDDVVWPGGPVSPPSRRRSTALRDLPPDTPIGGVLTTDPKPRKWPRAEVGTRRGLGYLRQRAPQPRSLPGDRRFLPPDSRRRLVENADAVPMDSDSDTTNFADPKDVGQRPRKPPPPRYLHYDAASCGIQWRAVAQRRQGADSIVCCVGERSCPISASPAGQLGS